MINRRRYRDNLLTLLDNSRHPFWSPAMRWLPGEPPVQGADSLASGASQATGQGADDALD